MPEKVTLYHPHSPGRPVCVDQSQVKAYETAGWCQADEPADLSGSQVGQPESAAGSQIPKPDRKSKGPTS